MVSFWSLTESGDFVDKIVTTNKVSRISSAGTMVLGPSTKSGYVNPTTTAGYYVNHEDASGFYYLKNGEPHRENRISHFSPKLVVIVTSIDFGDVPQRNYLYQRVSSPLSYPTIAGSQTKSGSFGFSKTHGLVINTVTSYKDRQVNIYCPVDRMGISMWFYRKATAFDPKLFSIWTSAPNNPQVSVGIEAATGYMHLFPTPTTDFDTTKFQVGIGAWTHILFLWDNSVGSVAMALNGDSDGVLYTATQFISASPSGILIGGSGTELALTPPTGFVGYIRRVEILNTTVYAASITDLAAHILKYSPDFVISKSCPPDDHSPVATACSSYPYPTTPPSPCSVCDSYSSTCFTPYAPEQRPDGTALCSSSCEVTYSTSCNLAGGCDACDDPLCLACQDSICLQCIYNSYVSDSGKCVCISNTFYVSSGGRCVGCDSSCKTCTGPNDPYQCTSCSSNLVFVPQSGSEGLCESQCPEAMTEDETGVCRAKCDSKCKTCSAGLNPNKCTSCDDGYYLVGTTEGPCVSTCPSNTTYNTTSYKCLPCDTSCLTCFSPGNATACLTCPNGTYKTAVWGDTIGTCSPNCSSNGTYTDAINLQCYPEGKCPITSYKNVDELLCEPCHTSCFGCTNTNDSSACRGCASQTNFLSLDSSTAISGVCVTKCDSDDTVDLGRRLCVRLPVVAKAAEQAKTVTRSYNIALYPTHYVSHE